MTAANESPEGLLLSLDTDKLRGTPTPQKENIPSFHDITLPGMEERGRTAGEGEEEGGGGGGGTAGDSRSTICS